MPDSRLSRDPKGWTDHDRMFAEIRRAYLEAVEEWHEAGGTRPVGEPPTHEAEYERIEDIERQRTEAAARAMPSDPQALVADVRNRNSQAIHEAITWLESDPFTWRTSYFKQKLMAALCGAEVSTRNQERLRIVLLRLTTRGRRQEFPVACRLARHVDNPDFRDALRRIAADGNQESVYAATRMLRACETKGSKHSAG
jgi:hypothetical protein